MNIRTSFITLISICLISISALTGCNSKSSSQNQNNPSPDQNAQTQINTKLADDINHQSFKLNRINQYVLDGFASEEIQDEIRKCFADFKNAVTSYQGKTAAAMMSESSLEYYKITLIAAQTALHSPKDYEYLSKRFPPSIRTLSSLLVKRMSAEFIDSATPLELYETGFNQGWIGYQSIASASLDNITAYHKGELTYYTADFYYDHTMSDGHIMNIGFELNNGECKIDLIPLLSGIDQLIENYIKENHLDPELMFQDTIADSETALDPKNWKPYQAQMDKFVAYFPKTPVVDTSSDEHVYSASHHLYGQFNVSVTYYSPGEDSPYHQKKLRDQAIMSFLVQLGVPKPMCTAGSINDDILIRCDLDIPEKDAKGKALWLFTKNRQYLITNVARSNQFNNDVAATFFEKFSYTSN